MQKGRGKGHHTQKLTFGRDRALITTHAKGRAAIGHHTHKSFGRDTTMQKGRGKGHHTQKLTFGRKLAKGKRSHTQGVAISPCQHAKQEDTDQVSHQPTQATL